MLRRLIIVALLFGVWLLWSGHFDPLLLSLGLGSCLLVVLISSRLEVLDEEGFPLRLAPRLVLYIPWVFWQIIVSNLVAAATILRPKRVHSHLIHVPVHQRTVIGQVIHANTITITPGTVSLDLRDGRILAHALTDDAASEEGALHLDERVCWVEGSAASLQTPSRGPKQPS